MRKLLLSAFVLMMSAGFTAAEESVDNPEFASWSKFPKGTVVTVKTTSTTAGTASEMTMINTLVETGSDKLVVETATVIKAGDQEIKTPGQKRDVPKTIEIPKGTKKEDHKGDKPAGTTEEGTETVKIAGKEFKTKWYKYVSEASGMKTVSKMWRSDDMPGMLVKMESTTTGTIESTTKMEVIEIKKP